MITVRIFGGLGNQMFQYAAGRALAEKNNVPLKLDISFFKSYKERKFMLNKFNISRDITVSDRRGVFNSKVARKIMSIVKFPKWYYRNYSTVFDERFFDLPENVYIDGYFQSEKYFADIEDILRNEFVPAFEVSNDFKTWKKKIQESNSVSIHVRRGDYLLKKNIEIHGILGVDYYKNAVSEMEEQIENPQFYIFSDDEKWCRENIVPFTKNGYVINIKSENRDVEELILMSACKHNVVANSSYSWWGAWLNKNENALIVAPKNWVSDEKNNETCDLLLPKWFKI